MKFVKRIAPYKYKSNFVIDINDEPFGVIQHFDFVEFGPYVRDDLIQV